MPSFVRRRRRTHCPVCEQTKMCGTYISRCREGDIYMNLRQDANQIIKESINRVLPDEAVRRVLMGSDLFGKKSGRIYLVAVGKAAWQMAAAASCRKLGYEPVLLTDQLSCEAREVGSFLAAIAKTHCGTTKNLAFIAGGETVVHLEGSGKGGRNQELELSAAPGLAGMENAALFSIGSDGTDGPTDAAGGYVDGSTKGCLAKKGMDIYQILEDNNAYEALKACDGLIMTGPTGTNVNDVAVLLLSAASVAETESLRATQAQDSRSTESA